MNLEIDIQQQPAGTDYPSTLNALLSQLESWMSITNQNEAGMVASDGAPVIDDQGVKLWVDLSPDNTPNQPAIKWYINGAWRALTGPPPINQSDLGNLDDGYYLGQQLYIEVHKCFWVWNGSAWEYPGAVGEIRFVEGPTTADVLAKFPGWVIDTTMDGRVPVGAIFGDADFGPGNTGGSATHTLIVDEIPAHTHQYVDAGGNFGGDPPQANANTNTADASAQTGSTGGGQPHNNLQPYKAYFCIKKT